MNIKLTAIDRPWRALTVRSLPVIVGSDPCADVHVAGPDVTGLHCMIDQVDGRLMVHDLVSQTGTFVNGRQVTESPVDPGDQLTLGRTSFRVQYQPSLKPTPGPPRGPDAVEGAA